jgi:GcrA cell cycle regulator
MWYALRRNATSQPVKKWESANSPQVVGNTALALHPFVIEAAAPQTVRDVVVPISEPVTIVELRESMCRWPIGDPAQRIEPKSSCRLHQ